MIPMWPSFRWRVIQRQVMSKRFPMRASDSSVGGGEFHTTRWTLVVASAQEQSRTGQAALAELCQIYWYPLYTFASRRGHFPHDAQDLTQGFFLHLLEHRALGQVDRLKGKFRIGFVVRQKIMARCPLTQPVTTPARKRDDCPEPDGPRPNRS